MPRFFLHRHSLAVHIPDDEGAEFPSLADAREEAIFGARELMAEEVLRGILDLRSAFHISDEAGTTLLVVPFGEVVEVSR